MEAAHDALSRPDNDPLLADSLAATWFAGCLRAEHQERLGQLGQRFRIPAGVRISSEGEPATAVSVVVSGLVALRTAAPRMGDVTLLAVQPDEVFSLSAVVAPYRATATAVAVSRLEAIALDDVRLRAALETDSTLAAALYPRLLEALANRTDCRDTASAACRRRPHD